MKYLQFEEAREQIRKLNIPSAKKYCEMFKKRQLPVGFPSTPSRYYPEFISWPDFLGNSNIAAKDKKFYSYRECQDYLLNANIDSKEKFEKWRRKKENSLVPSRPDKTFKKEWVSWGEFFKTGRIPDIIKHKNFLSYEEAKHFLKKFKFQNEEEFYAWAKTSEKPQTIPASPRNAYGKDFISMGDFLSNGNYKTKDWVTYEEYKNLVQSLKFNSVSEFKNWAKHYCKDKNYPANPCNAYPEFEGWPEFLGYQRKVSIGEKTISSILVANNIEHKLQYTIPDCKDISVLPFDVAIIHNKELLCLIEYQGIQHFIAVDFFGGEPALKQTQKRDKIKKKYCKKNNIKLLVINYKENLEEKLSSFLKTLNIHLDLSLERKPALNKNWIPFEEARTIIRSMNINSVIEYHNLGDKRPFGVPFAPNKIYKDCGWISWGDFLGTNKVQSKKSTFVSYEEAKKWFKDNNIQSGEHWIRIRRTKPNTIPSHPNKIYKNEWKGWRDFLS